MDSKEYLYILLHHPRTGGESLTTFVEKNLGPGELLRVNHQEPQRIKEKGKIRFLAGHVAYFGMHKFFPKKIPRYLTILRDPMLMLLSLYNSRMHDFPKERKQTFEKWYSLRKRNEMTLFFDEMIRSNKPEVVFVHRFKRWFRERIIDKIDGSKRIQTFFKGLMRKKIPLNKGREKLENAKKMLDKCWFIGITEKLNKDLSIEDNLQSDIKFLLKKMGVNYNWKSYQKMSAIPREFSILSEELRKKVYEENPLDVELYHYALKLNKKKKEELRLK